MTSKIQTQVMASVGAIYIARKLTGVRFLSSAVAIVSVLALWKFVWVHKVLENFAFAQSRGADTLGNYILTALSHAHAPVQISLLCALIAVALLVADFARSPSRSRNFAF